MTFRGLNPRTSIIRWGLLAIALGIVMGGTLPQAVREFAQAWATNRAILPWVFERLFGFLAYGALAGSVVYGLLLSTKLLDVIAHRPITFSLHQDLASIGLGLAGVHGALLALDHSVPFTLAQIVVPGLAPYAPLGVALGQIGFYLMLVVVGSFYVRRRIGQRAWRTLHYLTFLAFAGSTIHGVMAGTDSATPWAWWLYVGSSVVVVFLLGYRVALSVADRVHPRAAPAANGRLADTRPANSSPGERMGLNDRALHARGADSARHLSDSGDTDARSGGRTAIPFTR